MNPKLNVPSKSIILVFFIVFASFICIVAGSPPSEDSQGYFLKEPASDSDGVIQVLVLYDTEGLSGQKDWRTKEYSDTEEYRKGQEFLTGDVNAVIEGLPAPIPSKLSSMNSNSI